MPVRPRVRVEYGSYADGTERGPRTVYWSGRRSRPRPRQGTRGGRRHQGVVGRSRAVDDSDSSPDLLDRQGRADWPGLVEVRSSFFAREAKAVSRERGTAEASTRARASARVRHPAPGGAAAGPVMNASSARDLREGAFDDR